MNKNIIIAILVVIIIAAGAFIMFGHSFGKTDTQINLINKDTIQNGEQLEFELKDANGNPIAGQVLNITFNNEKYSVATDSNGKACLFISGIDSGKYNISVNYAGNDKYNGCTGNFNIEVTNDAPDNPATRTTGNSVASTQKNQTSSSNGGYDTNSGTYSVPEYDLLVRVSDNIVIGAPFGTGVGLELNDWIAKYGWDPYPENNDNKTQ